jgi:hypothetical protein
MLAQYIASPQNKRVMLRIFVTNTDAFSEHYILELRKLIKDINLKYGIQCEPFAILVEQIYAERNLTKNSLYGYDSTDMLLDFLAIEVRTMHCDHFSFKLLI